MKIEEQYTKEYTAQTASTESDGQTKSSTMTDQPSQQKKINPVWEYFQKYQGTITITDPNLM